jgi:hypothetical protein
MKTVVHIITGARSFSTAELDFYSSHRNDAESRCPMVRLELRISFI